MISLKVIAIIIFSLILLSIISMPILVNITSGKTMATVNFIIIAIVVLLLVTCGIVAKQKPEITPVEVVNADYKIDSGEKINLKVKDNNNIVKCNTINIVTDSNESRATKEVRRWLCFEYIQYVAYIGLQ